MPDITVGEWVFIVGGQWRDRVGLVLRVERSELVVVLERVDRERAVRREVVSRTVVARLDHPTPAALQFLLMPGERELLVADAERYAAECKAVA